jgi:hypothetical protein
VAEGIIEESPALRGGKEQSMNKEITESSSHGGRLEDVSRQPSLDLAEGRKSGTMRRILHDNGLSIAFFGLFLIFLSGQAVSGYFAFNQQQEDHGRERTGFGGYLASGHFLEGVFENWESEFLQLGASVLLSIYLFQRGSAVSKKPPAKPEEAGSKKASSSSQGPWPARGGGLGRWLYENSLALTFVVLFLLSFVLHAFFGATQYSQQQQEHGKPPVSVSMFLATSEFWYQSLQNYQSEFLALGTMAVLSIYLRQKGSPRSKPVDAPNDMTGSG